MYLFLHRYHQICIKEKILIFYKKVKFRCDIVTIRYRWFQLHLIQFFGNVHEKIIVLTISWSPVMMTSFPLSRSFKRKVLYHCKKTVQVSRRCSVHSFTFIFLCYFLLFFKLFTPQFPWDVYLHQWSLISCLFNSILIGDLTFISSVSCLGIISKDQNICSREACSLMYFKKTVSKRL